ncbi:TPA: hypothetical protein EYP27_01800 [Candidatus Bathyarchaeota archaeon]|nr:hypothetical protein [Candidatus Bathyarchaeota archaeon]
MAKHLFKFSNYPEREAILYCPKTNRFSFVKFHMPFKCPCCGELLEKLGRKAKIVLNYEMSL